MDKLLSVVMPSYNSSSFIRKSIESLLINDDRLEIVIVNDGSTDSTLDIALEYEAKYPNIISVVDKENGGHGTAVVAGLKAASGKFFKVLDSDDWFGETSLRSMLEALQSHGENVDLFLSNYVYEKEGRRQKRTVNYKRYFSENAVYRVEDLNLPLGTYIMMHSMVVRTSILKAIPLALPDHTFYVDNLYVAQALLNVRNFMYCNLDLYHYYIGRDDQSVNESVMIKRIDQQIKVNEIMLDLYVKEGSTSLVQPYFYRHLEIVTIISSVFLMIENTEISLQKKKQLWLRINEKDPTLYHSLRKGIMGSVVGRDGNISRMITLISYRLLRRFIGFN